MEAIDLLEIIARDEDSRHQFKANFTNAASLASEMVAFSNSCGGQIFIGVTNDGQIAGLSRQDIGRLNQLISNASSQMVRPPINPITENISLDEGIVLVVNIPSGLGKPYMDNNGITWVKNGADKRRVTSREEIQRMFQRAGLIHGDEAPANGMTSADINLEYFKIFFEKKYEESLDDFDVNLPQILENLNLAKDGTLNVAGALLFSDTPHRRLSAFIVKCVSFPGTDIHSTNYRDSEDIDGKLEDIFDKTMSFITRNIGRVQESQDVNSLGKLEIPKISIEELVTNALIHRDYFVSAPIKIFIFDNRIEIISPGHLPNNLTIQNIKLGNSNIRNAILASFATQILPYRGLGSGIRRALKEYPNIEFSDDKDGNQFIATIHRRTE